MNKILSFTIGDKTIYTSPYATKECPVETIIIYNQSKHANNVAISKQKEVWPTVKIIQCVQEGRKPHHLIGETDGVITIPKGGSWKSPEFVHQQYLKLLESRSDLRPNATNPKPGPGLYCAWSAQAEDPGIAREAIQSGFVWIGASPESMETIGTKIDYKHHCKKIGVKTSDFFVLDTHDTPTQSLEDYVTELALQLQTKYKESSINGEAIFLKSSYGGGGRGTIKIEAAECDNLDTLKLRLKKVITDTCRTEIYAEKAIDLAGATMFQLELEVNGTEIVPGGRLVWFNNNNQKILEIGLSDAEILKYIPKDVYDGCISETIKIAETSGYNNRGTNEILLTKKGDEWDFWHSEFNCRIQVEHEALGDLAKDKTGHSINGPAAQVMMSMGFAPPAKKDVTTLEKGGVLHLRLVNAHAEPKPNPWSYNGGTIYDIQNLPEGVEVLMDTGAINKATDAQFGRLKVTFDSWEDMCNKIEAIAKNVVIIGEGTTIGREYFEFLLKLSQDPEFRAMELACSRSSEMVKKPNIALSKRVETTTILASSVAPVIVDGYQNSYVPEEGKTYPSTEAVKAFKELEAELAHMPVLQSELFTQLRQGCEAKTLDGYYQAMRAQLNAQGGGLNTIFPRDTYQEGMNSQSAIILQSMKEIMEKVGASLFLGYETGGAQFEKANLDGLNSLEAFRRGLGQNVPSRCLTRSQWLNSLNPKSPKELRFVLSQYAKMIREELKLGENDLIPWFPNNFHAGNWDKSQNVTTGIMLEVGMTPVPTWAWDPRYSGQDTREWVRSQIELFKKHNRPLHELRIKNPGQQDAWTKEAIWKVTSIMREECLKEGIDPIIHIHNHNLDGKAATVACDLLKLAQSNGYNYLVIDTAPPDTTHNENTIVAKALKLTDAQHQALDTYNRMCHVVFGLTTRFDVRETTKSVTPHNSVWAGGTGSSDIESARKLGIAVQDIDKAKKLAWDVIGLGTVVTPFSEVLKRIGYAIYKNDKIVEKTREGVIKYIEKGGKLDIDAATLTVLQKWESRLPRPKIVAKLLENHGLNPTPPPTTPIDTFDLELIRQDLSIRFPNLEITEEHIMLYVAFGASALSLLKQLNDKSDLTWAMDNPAFVLADPKSHQVGLTLTVNGETLTLTKKDRDDATAIVTLEFKNEAGEVYQVKKRDTQYAVEKGIIIPPVIVTPGDATEIGAIGEGDLSKVLVTPGTILQKGQVIALLTIAKEQKELVVPANMVGMEVAEICIEAGSPVVLGERLFKVVKPTSEK
jgi:pyruvate carboxylase